MNKIDIDQLHGRAKKSPNQNSSSVFRQQVHWGEQEQSAKNTKVECLREGPITLPVDKPSKRAAILGEYFTMAKHSGEYAGVSV